MNCLLCDNDRTRPVWSLTGRDLRLLFREARHALNEKAYGLVTSEYLIQLFHCDACGFEFFDPALAGSGEFYEELDSGTYYSPDRPEFTFALDQLAARRAQSVLDIGGGSGAFLDLARSRGMKTYGLELNPAAVIAARAKGHCMLNGKLEEIQPEHVGGGVDAITLFQVVEHLPNPHHFLDSAANLLKVSGLLIISVPNRHGLFRLLPLDPANLPPHHITRWRAQDLRNLGAAHGLTFIRMSADLLYGRGIASFWNLQNRLARAIGQKPIPGGRWLPEIVSFFYRKLGCRFFFPRWGLSIYAAFQKKP